MREADIFEVAKDLALLLPTIHIKLIRPMEQQAKQLVSPLMFHAMNILAEEDTSTMTELAKKMNIAKQQLTPIMDKLIENNLVCREHDNNDRRIVKIRITEAGLHFLESFHEDISNNIKERIKCLDENDLLVLKNSLTDLYTIINKVL